MKTNSPKWAQICALTLLLVFSAQTGAPAFALAAPAAQDTPAVAAAPEVVIPDGTEISVVTTEEISSKTAVEGDPLTFRVDEDVVVGGKVVIAKGALVKGASYWWDENETTTEEIA